MKQLFIVIATTLITLTTWGQNSKTEIPAIKTKKSILATLKSKNITIDGNLNEENWTQAESANNFIMLDPDNGKSENENRRTEVKVLYDNRAIYIGAILYDTEPQKILGEITTRDEIGAADFFGVFINGFNDGQQEYSFFVTASNGQADCIRTSQEGEDFSWDAIWSSQAKITDKGWVVEMKIPYAALRFPKKDIQEWGLQFFREVRRLRHKYTWNRVDNKAGTFTQQAGILKGIKNISPPTRLFLMPYLSYYANTPAHENTKGTLKGGLDLKYGITDAFTVDAMLIPDFGQTKFDNRILNLGPFEQQFNENRPFFTEGTDLFKKGNLFYSRRIGAAPKFELDLKDNDSIAEELPATIKLINGLKFSGRTNKGLGIGILNAITENTNITVINKDPNNTKKTESRRETLEPLTNYNVFVLDKRFNQNSSISFINTNVTRNGEWQDANAYALVYDLNTKKNTFNLSGSTKHSIVQDSKAGKYLSGYANEINFSETSGKVRFNLGANFVSKDFDINDLGINYINNFYELYGNVNFRTLKSTKKLNSFRIRFDSYQQFNLESNKLQEQNFGLNVNLTTKKNHSAGIGTNITPFERYNYYDSRTEGRFVIYPKTYNIWGYISSNFNNKFAFETNPYIGFLEKEGWWYYYMDFAPRYRFNNRLQLTFRISINEEFNDLGWVKNIDDKIIFARRNRLTHETGLEGKYAINSKMNFSLNTRFYWSYAENKSFRTLEQDGFTSPTDIVLKKDSDFQSWNADLNFSWWFAPGSQITILYRNNAINSSNEIDKRFMQKFGSVLNPDKLHQTLSVSVRYFLDYNQAKKWFKKS